MRRASSRVGGLGAAAIFLQLGQRALELFEPLAQALHLLARLPHRTELVDRRLKELVDLVLDLLDAALDRLLSGANELVQQLGGQKAGAAPPLLENDLGEHLSGDIGAGAVVDDFDVLADANPLRQLIERDIAALLGVVELAALVAFDQSVHRSSLVCAALPHCGIREAFIPQCGNPVNRGLPQRGIPTPRSPARQRWLPVRG